MKLGEFIYMDRYQISIYNSEIKSDTSYYCMWTPTHTHIMILQKSCIVANELRAPKVHGINLVWNKI